MGVNNHKKERCTVPAIFTFRLHPQLKEELGKAADAARMPLNEFMAKVLADHINRPELAEIPRKSYGRPRKAIAS